MPIKYNSRTAQANAKQQQEQHQGALAANQQMAKGGYGTYINPSTGKDTRQFSGNDPLTGAPIPVEGSGTFTDNNISSPVGTYSSRQFVQPQPLVDQFGRQTQAGVLNQAQQNATQGKTSYDTSTGAVTGAGAINQNAVQRLENAGMNGSQIQTQMNGLQDNIQQTMGNTGLGVQYDANGNVIAGSGRLNPGQTMSNTPAKTKEQQRLDELNNIRITATRQVGTDDRGNPIYSDVFDPGATEAAKQAAKTRFATEDQNALTEKGQTVQKMGQNAAGDAASGKSQEQAPTTGSSGLDAALANLPPELAFLGPILQNVQQTGQESLNTLKDTSGKMWDNIQAGFNDQKGQLDQMKKEYESSSGAIQDLLKTVRDDQQKNITDQENAAKERLAWNELQQTRQINEQKRKAVDTEIASLALRGGFGSSAGLDQIEETAQHYEQALSDLQSEMGVQRTELAAKFTAIHTQATENYTQSSIENIKELRTGLQNIGMQGMSNARAKMEAENNLASTFMSSQINIRQGMAKDLASGAKEIANVINQSRDDKRAQEQLGWQRLEWVAQTYGSNAPQDLLDSIGKQLPGVDVKSVASQMTLAEMKKKGTGAGGGLGGFSYSQMQGTGEPPSFENFLKDKEKEALASGAVKFDTSASAMAAYKKEYEARSAVQKQLNPTSIIDRFEQRAAAQNLSGPVYKRTAGLINDYLKNGKYEQAASIVDNIGDDVNSTESIMFQQALNARYDVTTLHDAMQEIGQIGPITGRIKSLNPYNPAVVRVNRLLIQTVPNLARGVFREVGVLTDQDVARYTKTLENPELTVQQAQETYNDLMNKINVGLQNQINVWDAGNKRTKGFKEVFNSQPSFEQEAPVETQTMNYLNSLPR